MIQVTRVTYLRGTLALGEEIYSTVGEPVRVEDALHTTDASKDLGGGTGHGTRPSVLRSHAFRVTFLYVPGWWFTLSLGPTVCNPLRSYTFLLRSCTFRSRRVQVLLFILYVPIRSGTPSRNK